MATRVPAGGQRPIVPQQHLLPIPSGLDLCKKLVIGSSADPLPPRTYRLQVALMDQVGNVAQYVSETARVIGDALPRPTITRLNASALNVSASAAIVDVQWSTDELFKKATPRQKKPSPHWSSMSPVASSTHRCSCGSQNPVRRAGASPPNRGSPPRPAKQTPVELLSIWTKKVTIRRSGHVATAQKDLAAMARSSGQM